jgi:hypothetical protein
MSTYFNGTRDQLEGEALTSLDRSYEVLNLALLAEHERGCPGIRHTIRRRWWQVVVSVEGDPRGIRATILKVAEVVEEELKM